MSRRTDEQNPTIERDVVSMEWKGAKARAVVMRQTFSTSIDDLWDAITIKERLGRWLHPVSGDLREGGTYQLEGNAHGTILMCRPPETLSVTWEMHGGISWVNVTLEQVNESATRMTLEHLAHEDDGFLAVWKEYGPGSLGVGWELGLLALSEHIDTGGVTFIEDESTWMSSAVGRAFLINAVESWIDADASFGREAESARAAGDRTLQFYTQRGGK